TFSRIAARQILHFGDEFLGENVRHLFINDDSFRGHANLSLVHECTEGSSIDGGVEVSIVENDERSFTSQLKKNRLQMFRRSNRKNFSHTRGAGKVHATHRTVSDESFNNRRG